MISWHVLYKIWIQVDPYGIWYSDGDCMWKKHIFNSVHKVIVMISFEN